MGSNLVSGMGFGLKNVPKPSDPRFGQRGSILLLESNRKSAENGSFWLNIAENWYFWHLKYGFAADLGVPHSAKNDFFGKNQDFSGKN